MLGHCLQHWPNDTAILDQHRKIQHWPNDTAILDQQRKIADAASIYNHFF